MKKKQMVLVFSLVLAVFVANLAFGLPRLAKYSSVDEPYWTYGRISKFWTAVAAHKWRSTNINDKPGVTAAILAGPGLLRIDPMSYASLRQESKSESVIRDIEKINFSFRLPIYLTSLIFLLLFYLFLKELLGQTIALLSLIFIGLSPVILGISLIINPDSLLWGFLPLSILAYLIHQKKSLEEPEERLDLAHDTPGKIFLKVWRKKKYLILAGLFLGFSLLTKYVANILYVYLLGLLFLEYIFAFHGKKDLARYLKRSLLEYFFLALISMAIFFLFFPACWSSPEMVLKGTLLSAAFKSTWPLFVGFLGAIIIDLFVLRSFFSSTVLNFLAKYRGLLKKLFGGILILGTFFVLFNVYSGMKFLDYEAIVASPKGGSALDPIRFISEISANLYELIFSLTPFVFIFFLWGIFANSFRKNEESTKEAAVVLYLSIFIVLYYVASEVNHVVATTRYQIALFPMAGIIAAIGLSQALSYFHLDENKHLLRTLGAGLLAFVLSVGSLFLIRPYFFNYASLLLPQKYLVNFKDMGDGSFEAAQFLNTLPDAKNLIIWSDKGAVCETFLGTCKVGFSKADTKGFDFNYFVVSTGRKNRSLKMASAFYGPADFKKLYSTEESGIFRIDIGGRASDFVKVVPATDIIK